MACVGEQLASAENEEDGALLLCFWDRYGACRGVVEDGHGDWEEKRRRRR